jgi:methionyl-tRNA formyltransferase
MNVLVLGYENSYASKVVEVNGGKALEYSDKFDVDFLKRNSIEFIVSYGYRHIIKKDILDFMRDKVVNLHISCLPWNRGADPNLWSFLEDSPKGVTVHYMDEGVDTGDIIAQKEVEFQNEEEQTLSSTYNILKEEIEELFEKVWPEILKGSAIRVRQTGEGSSHKLNDKKPYMHLLDKGWDTSVLKLKGKAI